MEKTILISKETWALLVKKKAESVSKTGNTLSYSQIIAGALKDD